MWFGRKKKDSRSPESIQARKNALESIMWRPNRYNVTPGDLYTNDDLRNIAGGTWGAVDTFTSALLALEAPQDMLHQFEMLMSQAHTIAEGIEEYRAAAREVLTAAEDSEILTGTREGPKVVKLLQIQNERLTVLKEAVGDLKFIAAEAEAAAKAVAHARERTAALTRYSGPSLVEDDLAYRVAATSVALRQGGRSLREFSESINNSVNKLDR